MIPPESTRADEQEHDGKNTSSNAVGTAGVPEAAGKKSGASSTMSLVEVMNGAVKKLVLPKVLEIAATLGFLDKEELRKAIDSLCEKHSKKITQSSFKYIRGSVLSMKIDPLELMQEVMENNGLRVKSKRKSPKTPKKSDRNVREGGHRGS